MKSNEEELSKRVMEIEYIRRELEGYITALNSLQLMEESLSKSLLGLDGMNGSKNDVLLPYSQDVYFRGTISDTASALVNIGSNVFRSMSMDSLRHRLERDLSEIQKNIEQIGQVIQKLQERGSVLEQETNRMYEEYKAGIK